MASGFSETNSLSVQDVLHLSVIVRLRPTTGKSRYSDEFMNDEECQLPLSCILPHAGLLTELLLGTRLPS